MSGRSISIGLPGEGGKERSQPTSFLKYMITGAGKALAIVLVSISLVLGASARLLHPYSGYDIWFLSMTTALAESAEQAHQQVAKLVAQIQRADYEGDRAALKRLHDELANFGGSKQLAAQVQYWRAFALWRRAINGFNEPGDLREMQSDLRQAVDEFTEAEHQRPNFVDAKVGALSCLGMLGASMGRDNPARLTNDTRRSGTGAEGSGGAAGGAAPKRRRASSELASTR